MKWVVVAICSIVGVVLFQQGQAKDNFKKKVEEVKEVKKVSKKEMAKKILGHFDCYFYKLPFRKQGHYALRRYRTTGNSDFLMPALSEL